jgi:hypothetical protein
LNPPYVFSTFPIVERDEIDALSQATKVAIGIVPSGTAEPREVRDWKVENGDVRADPAIAQEILDFAGDPGLHRGP